ncbi:transposase [Streptococcus jiangjianxini]|uniref:transposase n=1 Tax=Streptococcus jiangjianxini TaxID=3161189 RepID=UPI00386685DF
MVRKNSSIISAVNNVTSFNLFSQRLTHVKTISLIRYSNAKCKTLNELIKVIKRNAFGFRKMKTSKKGSILL